MNKPNTEDEWVLWIKETWDAAQKAAWAEKPPQREWVGLTDDEIVEIANAPPADDARPVHSFARAIEAKLKEKNT